MKFSWEGFVDWYNQRELREQVFVMLSVLSILFMFWKLCILSPLIARQSGMDGEVTFAEKQLNQIKQELDGIKNQASPVDDINHQIERIEKEIRKIDANIGSYTHNLISPEEMAKALKDMLNETPGLRLISIQSEASQRLINSPTAAETAVTGDIQLYRHGMVLQFEGDYFSTYNYLLRLENLQWQLLWDSLTYTVKDHPTATVEITVHTLSDSEAWIGV